MSNKLPQPTDRLVHRLRRVAKHIDRLLETDWLGTSDAAQWKARANACWQCAARLEEADAALSEYPAIIPESEGEI